MAKSVTVNGYTFKEIGAGSVAVSGLGISNGDFGIVVADSVATLSVADLQSLKTVPTVSPGAYAVLSTFTEQDVGSIQAGLTNTPPAPTSPVPDGESTNTEQQNKEYVASGGIDDDSGSIQRFGDGSSIQTFDDGSTLVIDSDGNTSSTPTPTPPPTSNAGTTQAGKSGTPAGKTSEPKPGKRPQNPLGNFSSYTYQLSLYMITPDAYDAFIQSGRKNINAFQDINNTGNGVYLIAQSGGINNTTSKRAPAFDQDFFIDNLKITQAINGKETGSSTNTTELSFTITEPYGFSFVSRLKRAADALAKVSRSKNFAKLSNPTKQFFMLGIRFQGYDLNGNLINSKDIPGTDGDPQGNAYGIYERFYDIMITEMKFKIEGKAVTYNIKAVSVASGSAFGVKRGIIDQGAKVIANTVYNALMGDDEMYQGLLTKLNNDQKKLKESNPKIIPNEWDVVFIGDADPTIKLASIVSKADIDKRKWAMSKVNDTAEVNVSKETESPDNTVREITVPGGTPILQAVNQIILQSDFLTKALTKVYTTAEEPNPDGKDDEIIDDSKNQIKWYTMTAEVKNLGWDEVQNDFAYKTTYIIQTYDTPIVLSAYAKKTPKYRGPHKRYEYWFTGKNSEILRYEQIMDNTYFNVTLDASGNPNASGGENDITSKAGKPQEAPKQGLLGDGLQAQNSYMTSLYDPGALAQAKIQILGDPDFLMQPSPSSINALYNKFYGTDGYTVNPNGGQVFIEINFKEPIDYQNKDGLLSINESIMFWKYPPAVTKEINSRGGGISYMVLTCASTFSKGQFLQELTCVINTFPGVDDIKSDEAAAGRPSNIEESVFDPTGNGGNRSGAGTSAPTENGSSTTGNDINNTEEDYGQDYEDYNDDYDLPTDQQTIDTEFGPVQDDDASSDTIESDFGAYDDGGREVEVDIFGDENAGQPVGRGGGGGI